MAAITLSIDEELKEEYTDVCRRVGLTPSSAFNVFARAVVREQGIPFKVTARETSPREADLELARSLWAAWGDFESGTTFSRDDVRAARGVAHGE